MIIYGILVDILALRCYYNDMDSSDYRICYLSELGHKHFVYPTNKSALYSADCKYKTLNWVGGSYANLKAIQILKSCILPLSLDGETKINMSPPEKDSYTIVWIEK